MKQDYASYFNSTKSRVNVDGTFDRIRQGDDREGARYKYSLAVLYGRVLEVGAGDGYAAWLMAKNPDITHVTALEVQAKAVEKIRENLGGTDKVSIVNDSIEDYQPAKLYDCIHCGHTLEHVLHLYPTLEAMKALVKDLIVITVPLNGGLSRQHLRQFTDVDGVREMVSRYFVEREHRIIKNTLGKKTLAIISEKQ